MNLLLKRNWPKTSEKSSLFFLQGCMDLAATKTSSSSPIFRARSRMSEENLVLKVLLEADNQVSDVLDGQSRICNWLYNHLLEKRQELKQEFIRSGSLEAVKTL